MPDATLVPGFIPNRHRPSLVGRRMLGSLRWAMPGEVEPTPQRWQAIGEALMHGDGPMDRLVEWMFASGMRTARPLFERALEHGIDSMPEAPAPLREFFALIERRPGWVDARLLHEGAEVFRRAGMESLYVARDVSLMGGYQASAFNKTLLLTGALEKGPTRRFAETLRWALDCTAESGLERFSAGFKSTLRVRLIHAMVRRHVAQLPEWRMAEWGLPVNQPDMAATLIGVFSLPLLGARLMGMPQTRRERDAAAHLARYVGWLSGVELQWLPNDERSALKLLGQLLLSLANPDPSSAALARPLMDEPLRRPYARFAALRGRYDRARHLSISRLFLGAASMRNLGLPTHVLPWYPLLNLPFCLARHLGSHLLPGGKARAARTGRRAQEAFLRLLSGGEAAVVGAAAQGLASGTSGTATAH